MHSSLSYIYSLKFFEKYLKNKLKKIGLQNYLKKYKYKNAKTSDLWNELSIYSPDNNIADLMQTWTKREGYPLVKVKINLQIIKAFNSNKLTKI